MGDDGIYSSCRKRASVDEFGFGVKGFVMNPSWTVAIRDKDVFDAGREEAFYGRIDFGGEQPLGLFVILAVGIALLGKADDAGGAFKVGSDIDFFNGHEIEFLLS